MLLYQYKSKEAQMPQSRTETIFFGATTNLLQRLRTTFVDASTRRRDRRLLARLDPHLLRDIGLSPDDAQSEAAKPFWRP
jgi:uncharacterized protein YjiS (DUF1127 family)